MRANCIIVDDEPISRDVLRKYIRDIPSLNLIGECKDAFEATSLLADDKIDIIFLDVNMPRLSGISFARSLTNSPMLIFTTAYPEYAVEGFNLDAIDYLVKPFSFERFIKSVNKAVERLQLYNSDPLTGPSVIIRSEKKIYSVKLSSLVFIEGCGDYIKIILADEKTLIVHDTMKGFIATLPERQFMRIHKSFAINLDFVDHIDGNTVMILKHTLPISPGFRQELIEKLK